MSDLIKNLNDAVCDVKISLVLENRHTWCRLGEWCAAHYDFGHLAAVLGILSIEDRPRMDLAGCPFYLTGFGAAENIVYLGNYKRGTRTFGWYHTCRLSGAMLRLDVDVWDIKVPRIRGWPNLAGLRPSDAHVGELKILLGAQTAEGP